MLYLPHDKTTLVHVNDLVPSGNKTLPDSMLTHFCVVLWVDNLGIIFTFFIISQQWDDPGSVLVESRNTVILHYHFHGCWCPGDTGARASAAMWMTYSLQWRHNEHDGVSNRRRHYYLLNRLYRHRSKKTSKLRVTGLCAGNSPGTGEFPHKWPVTRKMFPFDDVSAMFQPQHPKGWFNDFLTFGVSSFFFNI